MCDPYEYPQEEIILVLDTNKYAGNFERELCAYMTGYIGECGVGKDSAALFCEEMSIDNVYNFYERDYVGGRTDEHGCFRPVSIWPSPDRWADSVGNDYPHSVPLDDPEVIRTFEETVERTYKSYDEKRRMERLTKGPYKTPAYTSVAIYLEERPPNHIMDLWVERAKVFCQDPQSINKWLPEQIGLIRVRLLRWVVAATEEELEVREL